jgi:hypothetical protein
MSATHKGLKPKAPKSSKEENKMTKFYVTIEEVVEKVVLIEVDTDNKKEAKDIYNGKKEGNMIVLSESEENGLGITFKKIYTEKEYLG